MKRCQQFAMFTLEKAKKAQRGGRDIALLSVTLALDGGRWSMPHTGRFAPGKETQSPLYKGLGWIQGWFGQVPKIMPLPAFNPWMAQPLARHNTNCAITLYQVHQQHTFAF